MAQVERKITRKNIASFYLLVKDGFFTLREFKAIERRILQAAIRGDIR